ncbi:hypothetical protein IQ06DRAFT_321658 [Phaeosphaeriaceae sp. SRC1lsM3a]|nr:hypothetical protein IQ06DRAFT_321658 [Stagonospora sp. SRC1lsM3a]
MSATPPPLPSPIATMPMGFAGQLKAIQDNQRRQEQRITELEHENAQLRAAQRKLQEEMTARITTLEEHNANQAARRRETVCQLLNLRTHHQEATNAFQMRSQDIQPDDLEGMLSVYANSITTVMNHHQRILSQLRSYNGYNPTYATQVPSMHPQQGQSVYPMAYTATGYCRAHNIPYWCRTCGQ